MGEAVVVSDSSPPDLLADVEGARCAAPPQKSHLRIGPLGHVTDVPPNFEVLATPLTKIDYLRVSNRSINLPENRKVFLLRNFRQRIS